MYYAKNKIVAAGGHVTSRTVEGILPCDCPHECAELYGKHYGVWEEEVISLNGEDHECFVGDWYVHVPGGLPGIEGSVDQPAERILNLTQHAPTADQVAAGVFDTADRDLVVEALTFNEIPDSDEIQKRVTTLLEIIDREQPTSVMLGGAPYLMGPLEQAVRQAGVCPLYSFTRRESVDQPQPDGSVCKEAIFRHVGWVRA